MARWSWAGASCRGVSHVRAGTRRQDAFTCFAALDGTMLACIVSDGAGSASHGGEGASLVCRSLALALRAHFARSGPLPSDDDLLRWIDEARDRIGMAARTRGLTPRDFAATLVLALTDGAETLVVHIGDGACVARHCDDGHWRALSWPAQGEYASTTFFVTDDPQPRVRIVRSALAVDAVACFTDGIERLALDYAAGEAFQPFFRGMIQPLERTEEAGRDATLSGQLGSYLDASAINERTDDDKTLVLARSR